MQSLSGTVLLEFSQIFKNHIPPTRLNLLSQNRFPSSSHRVHQSHPSFKNKQGVAYQPDMTHVTKAYNLIGQGAHMFVSITVDDHAAGLLDWKNTGRHFQQNITTLFRTTKAFHLFLKITYIILPFFHCKTCN